MRGRAILFLIMMWAASATAAQVVDATGRTVQVPDRVTHVVPADETP